MPKSKPVAPPEVTITLDRMSGLSVKNRGLMKAALTPPYSPVEWGLLRRAVFVPVDAKGVIELMREFLENRARDPRCEKTSRELCRKAVKIVKRDEEDMDGERNSPMKRKPSPISKNKLRPALASKKRRKTKMPVYGNPSMGRHSAL